MLGGRQIGQSDQLAAGGIEIQQVAIHAQHADKVAAIFHQREELLAFFLGQFAMRDIGRDDDQRFDPLLADDRTDAVGKPSDGAVGANHVALDLK